LPEPLLTITELARFDAPGYIAPTLRSSTDPARQQFRDAMTAYQSGRYRAAIAGFRAAVDLDASAPDSNFFLGVCYLLVDETDAGIHSLRNTIALGDSPFLEEAYFYLAKALLRQNQLAAAQQQLRQVIRLNGDRQNEARRLSEQLSRLQREPSGR
jgi:TolA-binding protein